MYPSAEYDLRDKIIMIQVGLPKKEDINLVDSYRVTITWEHPNKSKMH